MNTNRLVRFVALPALCAGAVGIAALGLAGTASAGSYSPPQPRPGIVAVPDTYATPAPNSHPGAWWGRHHAHLHAPSTAKDLLAPYNR